jgi:hypothetical protein
MLLNSPHDRAFVQLVTGFVKSLMLGLMARYLNIMHGNKVVVVVPNEVLAVIQQQKYSPWSSKVGENLLSTKPDIHYCTYDNFLSGNIPLTAVLLVDEADSMFFPDAPTIVDGKLLSAILLLNKYKVIGVTATFRGE